MTSLWRSLNAPSRNGSIKPKPSIGIKPLLEVSMDFPEHIDIGGFQRQQDEDIQHTVAEWSQWEWEQALGINGQTCGNEEWRRGQPWTGCAPQCGIYDALSKGKAMKKGFKGKGYPKGQGKEGPQGKGKEAQAPGDNPGRNPSNSQRVPLLRSKKWPTHFCPRMRLLPNFRPLQAILPRLARPWHPRSVSRALQHPQIAWAQIRSMPLTCNIW